MKEEKQAKSGTPGGIRDSLKKATTEMLVLSLLKEKPMYTYEMMAAIETRSNGVITFNTLYQSIYRLEHHEYIRQHGKLISEDNRVRIFFAITEAGEEYLKQITHEYLTFTNSVDALLGIDRKEGVHWRESVI